MSNKPIAKLNLAGVSIAIWGGEYPSYSIQRRYKDKQSGEWKDAKSWDGASLAVLSALIPQALAIGAKPRGSEPEQPAEPKQREVPFDEDDIPF